MTNDVSTKDEFNGSTGNGVTQVNSEIFSILLEVVLVEVYWCVRSFAAHEDMVPFGIGMHESDR